MKRLADLVGVFSHSAVINDALKGIQKELKDHCKVYELVSRNDTRYTQCHPLLLLSSLLFFLFYDKAECSRELACR